ncbi:Big_13 domain-containing protein [Pycnococcus provasolii]
MTAKTSFPKVKMAPASFLLVLLALQAPLVVQAQIPTSYTSPTEGSIRLVNGQTLSEGRLEIWLASQGSWGTVCDDSFDNVDASVVCAQLGYTGGTQKQSAFFGEGVPGQNGLGTNKNGIYMDDVACAGGEANLLACGYINKVGGTVDFSGGVHNCEHSEDVGVCCTDNGVASPCTGPPTMTFSYVSSTSPTEGSIRLVNGHLPSEGRLEIWLASQGSWGTVCDDSFGSADASVVCAQLGYTGGTSKNNAYFGEGVAGQNGLGTIYNGIYMDDVACAGGEANLLACGYNNKVGGTVDLTTQPYSNNCGHDDDVGVCCTDNGVASPCLGHWAMTPYMHHSLASSPGAQRGAKGGAYYATGTSFSISWTTTTAPSATSDPMNSLCYCNMRASRYQFAGLVDFTGVSNYGTTSHFGAADTYTDSFHQTYSFDWQTCGTAGGTSHTYNTGTLPEGYYVFSVTCARWDITALSADVAEGAFNYAFKVDNVAPSSAITQSGGASTFDPSPNSGNGYYNGLFSFDLSATDYYGTVPYTTQNKVGCAATGTFNVADDPNTAATEAVACEYSYMTYMCAVDNGAYAACGGTTSTLSVATFTTAQLLAGEHVLRVKAIDNAGNTETYPSFYSFSVRPHAKNAGCTFRYDLDSAGYTSLGSTATKTLSGLTDGSHTFGVLAVDSVSNVGTAQSFTWTVDTTPPTATITKTWSAQNNPTSTAGVFTWSFSEAGSYSKYSTDGTTYTMPGTLTATTVTLAANTFPIGSRSFKVYGVDLLGNAGSAATDSFTVEPIDTAISTTGDYACSSTMSSAISSSSVTYSITATIDQNAAVSDYTYMYKLDSGSWKQGVTFPAFGIKGLSEGVHQVEAKAYTSGGVVDPTPACRMFVIDMTAPVTTITAPGASSQGATATFGGKVTDANIMATGGTTYRVEKVGDASFSSVSGSVATAADGSFTITLSSLADGLYQVYVRHTDMAGNVGSETMVEWTVDTAVPNTMVSSGPSSPTASTTATFLFACDEPPCTYKYKVDSADNYSTSSSARLNLSSIASGIHTIEVHAIDVAGNEDISAAAYTWTVFDATAFEELKKRAKFTMEGAAPFEFSPPDLNYVHL